MVTVCTLVTGVERAGQLVTSGAQDVMVSTEVAWIVMTPGVVTTLEISCPAVQLCVVVKVTGEVYTTLGADVVTSAAVED